MSDERPIGGIHHVTAIASDPQRNVDFYGRVLGLRLVKRTVNFDDPGTYHLYYGDEIGRPGTILTFFPWPGAGRGSRGTGQQTATAFAVPPASLGYWQERLARHAVAVEGPRSRWGDDYLTFADPDGLLLELVAWQGASARPAWAGGPVPAEHAIRGFYGLTLCQRQGGPTAELLAAMGFRARAEEGLRQRFEIGDGAARAHVDLLVKPGGAAGRIAAGSVHHVAWRVADEGAQLAWRRRLLEAGLAVTEVRDRRYFRSIYFREPGGVLFELATDGPGFTRDEPAERLGESLKLPPWLEAERARLEAALPPLEAPA
ncbi:MAG: ring-cleaving dioxygenase [Acidobacteria bacterium]|nr:MAG: ring-cleaving dioxygenase [Acidobacteriota bacterium]